jgi:hypothetical protein
MFAHHPWRVLAAATLITGLVLVPSPAGAAVPSYPFAGPVFGLTTAPDGSLLVADSGAGIVELRKNTGTLIVDLPGVTDVEAIGRGSMFAITGGGEPGTPAASTARKLWRASHGSLRQIADLGAFEAAVNPDGGEIDSNPFDVEALSGGKALVADAGGNDLLVVDRKGHVDWVATLPEQLVSTANAKMLAGCPDASGEFAFVCDLPARIPAQAVATSVAIGPDGAYYVGELTGFPGEPGKSRIWRIEPGTRHATCGTSPACTVVASGFTSIVDLTFGPDGTLYVVEIDEASFLAVELQSPAARGGTVNACAFGTWTCTAIATDLPIPIAATVGKDGTVYVVINALVPGETRVIALP